MHLAASVAAELMDELVAHRADATTVDTELLGHLLQARLEDRHVCLHLRVVRSRPAAALCTESPRRAKQQVERAAIGVVVECEAGDVDRVGLVLGDRRAIGDDLQRVAVLAKELDVVERHQTLRGQALDRSDLAQMRLHRRHVSLRLLKEDVLQGHVGGGVGGHVGQRANDRKQPTALALHEGRDRCRREPEGNVGLLGGELGSRRIRAGGGRRHLQLGRDLRDARARSGEDGGGGRRGRRQRERCVDCGKRLLDVLVSLQVGAAVALDDGADLLLLLVHLGQRTAVAPTPLAHRLDEQHDVGYVGVVSGRERRKVSIAPGDELLEAGRRGEDTQVGHLMVRVRLDHLVLLQREPDVAHETVRVHDDQRNRALGAQ
mmetsp:Transcript_51771/g.143364  ORF Transcript_51771/g.143364 Transcript_51771/m.143364 type:complete len:376 (+) Transcript_51771:724-1851(+)